MKTQLIKFEDHNIIVSDEEIKEGDYYLDRLGQIQECEYIKDNILNGPNQTVKAKGVKGFNAFSSQPKDIFGNSEFRKERKIIASDGNPEHNLPSINYNGFEEKFGAVNIEKLARDYALNNFRIEDEEEHNDAINSLINFCKKAQSLNDKKFSLEDMREAMKYASSHLSSMNGINKHLDYITQQPKVFDIEVEMEAVGTSVAQGFNMENISSDFKLVPKIKNNQIKIIKTL